MMIQYKLSGFSLISVFGMIAVITSCQPTYYKSEFGNYLPTKPKYWLCEQEFNLSDTSVIETQKIYQSTAIRFDPERKTHDTTYYYLRFFPNGTCFSKWLIGRPSSEEYEQSRNGFPGCWRLIDNRLFIEHYNHHFAGTYFLIEFICRGDTLYKSQVKSGRKGTWTKSEMIFVKVNDIVVQARQLEENPIWNVRN